MLDRYCVEDSKAQGVHPAVRHRILDTVFGHKRPPRSSPPGRQGFGSGYGSAGPSSAPLKAVQRESSQSDIHTTEETNGRKGG